MFIKATVTTDSITVYFSFADRICFQWQDRHPNRERYAVQTMLYRRLPI